MSFKQLCVCLAFIALFFWQLPRAALAISFDWSNFSSKFNTNFTPVVPKMMPSPTPKVIFRVRPRATGTPTPTTKPQVVNTPTPTATTVQSGTINGVTLSSIQIALLDGINQFRTSQGKASVKPDSKTCAFAETRANEITSNFSHAGFDKRVADRSLPYPGYSLVTENLAMTSDYKRVVQMWIDSPGHRDNMLQDTPYVCVAQKGNYYAYEGWKP